MAKRLTSVMAKLFRDRAQATSLRDLRREGHRSVRVLDLAHLDEILGRALETALADAAVDPETAARLNESAGSELARMLGRKEGLERTNQQLQRQHDALAGNVEQLQDALEEARGELDEAVAHGTEGPSPRDRLRAAWEAPLGATQERWSGDDSAQQAIDQLHRALEDATVPLLGALRASSEDDEGDVEVLRRRVRKLKESLDDAHQMMARLEARPVEDTGVASIHDSVQGLKGDEQNFTHRKELLREVFQLNLELRDDLAGKAD